MEPVEKVFFEHPVLDVVEPKIDLGRLHQVHSSDAVLLENFLPVQVEQIPPRYHFEKAKEFL